MPDENKGTPPRALVVERPGSEQLRVGGIGVRERWERSLTQNGAAQVYVLPVARVRAQLATANEPVLLAWDGWVMEHLAGEPLIEEACVGLDDDALTVTAGGGAAPLFALSPKAARRVSALSDEQLASGPDAVLQLLADCDDLTVEVRRLEAGYWARVDDASAAPAATWGLLERLRWRPGGVIAKWINRPISIRLSKHLLDTPVTPNQTTIFAFLVGAVGVWMIFSGGYWGTVAGTTLLQINSVLDGIDGELARMRQRTSEFGAYLDSVCDEVLNAGLLVAVGYHLTHIKYDGDPMYWYIGIFAAVAAFAHALVHWHCKWKHGLGFYWWFEAYKPRKQVQRSTSPFAYFKKLFWKESYLFLFMWAAIFDVMELLMWISAAAAAVVYVLFFIHIPIKRARW